jgi:hypothetical protein
LEKTPEEVIAAIFAEAARRDSKGAKLKLALVNDNRRQIAHLERLAEEQKIPLVMVVDFIHVAQYVWAAAQTLFLGEAERDGWVREHLLELLRGKPSLVAAGIRRRATLRGMTAAARQPVDAYADYLLSYVPYLRYHEALAQGVPIATGAIEGACRHLVEDRMNFTGARCSLVGAQAVLRLRALRSSEDDDLDEYWAFHEQQEYDRNHASRYADRKVPQIGSSTFFSHPCRSQGGLKLIKKGDS